MFYKAYIEPWLFPPGVNILLIFFGIVMSYFKPRTGQLCLLLGFISLWLLSTPWFAYRLVNLLEIQYPLLTQQSPLKQSAIVVLGGGDITEVEYNNKHSVSDATLHRLNYAAYLAHKLKLPIVVSGGKLPGTTISEADLMATYLHKYFNIKDVIQDDNGNTTAEEARYIKVLANLHRYQTLYLVTNAWHMPRTMYAFACTRLNIIPAPMGYYDYVSGNSIISMMPSKDALVASATAFHEGIGLIWYRLRYSHAC